MKLALCLLLALAASAHARDVLQAPKCNGASKTLCSGVCTNLMLPANCGACSNKCGPGESCAGNAKKCKCGPVWASGLGAACRGDQVCANELCSCPAPTTECDAACRVPAYFTTTDNCGTCGTKCDTDAGEVCLNGACSCPADQAKCGGVCQPTATHIQCGDECRLLDSFLTDDAQCGACGADACDTANGYACAGGVCGCPADTTTECDAACRVPAYFTTTDNCGTCGTKCDVAAGEVCLNGACSCPAGQDKCGGVCVDRQTDENNCGACGTTCNVAGGETCNAGVCGIVCTASSGCPDSVPICGDNGICRKCISNGDQGKQCADRALALNPTTINGQCDYELGTCVQCNCDGSCVGDAPVNNSNDCLFMASYGLIDATFTTCSAGVCVAPAAP